MTLTRYDKISLSLSTLMLLVIGYMLFAYLTGRFAQHKSWVYAVDSNRQGLIISGSENEVLLWEGRRCVARLASHQDAIKTVAFSKNGQLFASGSIDQTVKVWFGAERKGLRTLTGHRSGVNKVEFSVSDKYLVSAGYDDKLFIWDWKSGIIVKEFDIEHTWFSINPSDVLAYVDSSCNLRLFDLRSLSPIKTLGQYCGAPVFHPKENIIAVNEIYKSRFTFIDANTGAVQSLLDIKTENNEHQVSTFEFSPDGQFLAAAIWGGDIEVWDWRQKKLMRTLSGHDLSGVDDLAFNHKNELLSASGDRSVKIWNWKNGNLKMVIGDGLFAGKLRGLFAVLIVLTLAVSFWAISKDASNKYSSFVILAILSVWSLGIFLILNLLRKNLVKASIIISWIATILSGLFIVSVWFSWLSIFTIPIGLFFGYILFISDRKTAGAYITILLNLFFAGIICSFVISAV